MEVNKVKSLFKTIKINKEDDLDVIYVTTISLREDKKITYYPSFWVKYGEKLVYGICYKREMSMFESLWDWNDFNFFSPKEKELNTLLEYKPIFYDIVYQDLKTIEEWLCDWEWQFIDEWNREIRINKILKND